MLDGQNKWFYLLRMAGNSRPWAGKRPQIILTALLYEVLTMMLNIQASARRMFAVALLLVTVVFTSTTFAQLSGKGSIRGTVMDKTGAVVPNASVVATNNDTNVATSRRASSSGDYEITPLNPGNYTLTVKVEGFEGFVQQNIHVNALEVANIDVHLALGEAASTITVTEQTPALETTNATLGATMENSMYSALPIEMGSAGSPDQRRATDFALLMPGVQGNETNGNATTNTGVVNGGGSRGATTAVYINGVPFTRVDGEGDPRYVWTALSVDAVDQFQLETNGYPAMYEGQGVQNYTVKSGTNKYHGYIYDFNRNTLFDTWGFFAPGLVNPFTETTPGNAATGHATKPTEHENEFGIVLSGPIIKNKLFYFGQYGEFRFTQGPHPTFQTQPTAAMRTGDFTAAGLPAIFDPRSTNCVTVGTATSCTRTQFVNGTTANQIPLALQSAVARSLQAFIPANTNANLTNNYLAGYKAGLTNWSTTHRLDYTISAKNNLSVVVAQGRQASSVPTGQTTAGRNLGPIPINFGQAFTPKTTVIIAQDVYTITPHIVNQMSYGFARYNGPTINTDRGGTFGAAANHYGGLPAGQAQDSFPTVNFGTNGPDNSTTLAGEPASRAIANSYAFVDNVEWTKGRHIFTIGGEIAWMQYQNTVDTGGTSPLTIQLSNTETAQFNAGTANAGTSTGQSYASFLTGAPDSVAVTQTFLATETGARFRPVSPYIQDTWKATNKLTVDMGLRYDFYPPYKEENNKLSWLNPSLPNVSSGNLGAIQFAGGVNGQTNIKKWWKNWGPRVGVAYAVTPKTVLRGSWGVMYTHGNGVGGAAGSRNGTGTLGFSAANTVPWTQTATFAANPNLDAGFPASSPFAPNISPTVNTGYFVQGGVTSPAGGSGIGYGDTYLGGRAPEYVNWSVGFQHEITNSLVLTAAYVGSEGHFEIEDNANGRGQFINQLDPKFLAAGAQLGANATPIAVSAALAASGVLTAPNYNAADFDPKQKVSQALLPFPQYKSTTDTYGNYANSFYQGMQFSLNKRMTHGLSYMANYTFSKSIDNGGTFRSGYDIPALYNSSGRVLNHTRIERSESTSSQRHHLVLTGVYAIPTGAGHRFGGGNAYMRRVFSGYQVSGIFQAYSGSPLALTASSCGGGTNGLAPVSEGTCLPSYNPAFTGPARIHGSWGQGVTATNVATQFIDPTAFITTISSAAAPMYSNAARTAPYKLFGPGNYDLDLSLRRVIDITSRVKFTVNAELYNVTNHVQFGGIGTTFGSASFGTVSTQANNTRQAQFSGKLDF
jgi:Carboxypeptidase regulatory-like domain